MRDPAAASHRVLVTGTLALLLCYFIAPALALSIDADAGTGVRYGLVPLLALNPAVILVLSVFSGRRYGVGGLVVLAAALALFVLSTLVLYNASAMVYALFYLPGGVVGWALGLWWRARTTKRAGVPRDTSSS